MNPVDASSLAIVVVGAFFAGVISSEYSRGGVEGIGLLVWLPRPDDRA